LEITEVTQLLDKIAKDPCFIEKKKKSLPVEHEEYLAAYLFYEKGHYKEASSGFARLIMINGLEKKYWTGLAASEQQAKNYQNALPAWAMAAILDPENPTPHFHAAECLISQNEIKEAMLALEEAKRRSPEKELLDKINALKEIWQPKGAK